MKRLIAAIVLALSAFSAYAEDARVQLLRDVFTKESAERGDTRLPWIIEETEYKVDLGEGESIVANVTRDDLPHYCFVAIHPTEASFAMLECFPKAEGPKIGL